MSASVYASELPTLDLGRACKWMFSSPNWLSNLFWVVICMLLGVVLIGHMVLVGYQIEIFQHRMRGRAEENADFRADKFSNYLIRGFIPFVLNLIYGFGAMIVLFVIMGVWSALFSLVFGKPDGLLGLIYMIPLMVLAVALALAALFMFLPLAVRAGLTNNLSEGFNFSWALATAQRMWPTFLLCALYAIVIGLLAELAGVVTCFIGLLVTIPWAQLALTDLVVQAYDIYEAKGGEPIPVEPI